MKLKKTRNEDILGILVGEPPIQVLSKKLPKEAPKEYGEFVVWFMEKNKSRIQRHAYRRCIPNRYTTEDVCAYIAESILRTLRRRKAVGRPIEEPKLYFSKMIDFYCVEYQRMHGFIYGLPKRPRAIEAEQDIGQYGFNYLEPTTDIGYLDGGVHDDEMDYGGTYLAKGVAPSEESEVWNKLMGYAQKDDRDILNCVYNLNMSIQEASKHLGIAISTAYQRANRGIRAISGAISLNVDLDQNNWKVFKQIEDL